MLLYLFVNFLGYIIFHEFNSIVIKTDKNSCDNLYSYPFAFLSRHCYKNSDYKLNTEELISQHGYNSISYTVTTDDGYILTLFRIPPKFKTSHNTPIFLQHGISSDSTAWVDIGNRSLAFKLADEGYDVWLGNIRGNSYAKQHLTLSPKNKQFWNYNLDKIAQNDIRASLKLVAHYTQRPGEIIYVGYSLGSTLILMYAADFPDEAQTLLRGIVGFSPVVYFDPTLFMKIFLNAANYYGNFLQRLGIHVINSNPEKVQNFHQQFCRFLPNVCTTLIRLQYGKTYQMRPDDLLMFYSHYPESISVQQLLHYGQIYKKNKFQKYDYGLRGNLNAYKQAKAPVYDLSKIQIPVSLYYGQKDTLISERNVERIMRELGGKNNYMHRAPVQSTAKKDQFNHMDFIYAWNITSLFYEDLFQRIFEITQGF